MCLAIIVKFLVNCDENADEHLKIAALVRNSTVNDVSTGRHANKGLSAASTQITINYIDQTSNLC